MDIVLAAIGEVMLLWCLTKTIRAAAYHSRIVPDVSNNPEEANVNTRCDACRLSVAWCIFVRAIEPHYGHIAC
jgi:hypothetical protein